MSTLEFPPDTAFGGRYRPVRTIARGGMGLVVEAVDDRLHRPVAVKLVNTTAPHEADRLRAEALALARLHHPNIVAVYDTGEHDGRPFIVTELVRGESLRELIDREGPLPVERMAAIGADVARALECAHGHGIVHRDLKPANVLVEDATGRARLIDFGIATSEHAVALTHTGLVIGTPAYLSPEQVDGSRAGPASDLYSLAIVLLEAATGRVPFPGTTTETLAARLVRAPDIPEDLGPRWGWLLGAMTRREPEQRPPTASVASLLTAMADALRPRVEPAFPDLAPAPVDGPTRVVPAVVTGAAAAGEGAPAAATEATTVVPERPAPVVAAAAAAPAAAAASASGSDAQPWPTSGTVAGAGAAAGGTVWAPERRRRWVRPVAAAAVVLVVLLIAAGMALAGRSDAPAVAGSPDDEVTTSVPASIAPVTTEVTTTVPPTTEPPTTAPPTTEPAVLEEPAPAPAPIAPAGSGGKAKPAPDPKPKGKKD